MSAGRRSNSRYPRSRAARLAIPLAVPMALGLTLGIILGVSGGTQHTSIQQAPQAHTVPLVNASARPTVSRSAAASAAVTTTPSPVRATPSSSPASPPR